MGIQDQGAHQQRAGLANGNQMGRVSGKVFQMGQYLFVLVNLAIEIFPMPLLVNIKGNISRAFLLHYRHSAEPLISQMQSDTFGNIGMMSGTRRKYHSVIMEGMFDFAGNVENL